MTISRAAIIGGGIIARGWLTQLIENGGGGVDARVQRLLGEA